MQVSVIIPALNEERFIEESLRSVEQAGAAEVIVVDGGSTDRTCARASGRATIVNTAPQRARQMNVGARVATGDVLLFLHADTTLDPRAVEAIRQVFFDRRTVGGTFSLQFDEPRPVLRFYTWFTKFRCRLFHYGDQGIFVRKQIFDAMAGFSERPLMEDVDFLSRLRREGNVAVAAEAPVTTSARRFVSNGIVRQQLLNIVLVTLFYCGVSPTTLARLYGRTIHGTASSALRISSLDGR